MLLSRSYVHAQQLLFILDGEKNQSRTFEFLAPVLLAGGVAYGIA